MRFKVVAAALIGVLSGANEASAARTATSLDAASFGDPRDLCAQAIAREEREQGIPARLMQAIALTESGRWDAHRQTKIAWPWTINAEGEGRYFPSMGAAIAAVRALKARGVNSIDVGCMQVNLRYHGDAFSDLTEAFEPATNVAYAADFLKTLYQQTGSWTEATGRYHSATPELNGPYKARVLAAWNDQRRLGLRGLAAEQRQLRLLPLNAKSGRQLTLEQRIEAMRQALAATPSEDRPIPLREIWLRTAEQPVMITPGSRQPTVALTAPKGASTPPLVVRVTRPQTAKDAGGGKAGQDGKAFTEQRVAYLQAWREQQQRDQDAAKSARAASGRNVSVLRGDGRTVERVQTR
ncbi:MAG: lytic transglycosylase domain-containing protein [Rhodospirillales bacterium]|jgi:hypothetical protein|nr:lytic transglycosylase domain-containing protein [Rhodospirillales bacterium]